MCRSVQSATARLVIHQKEPARFMSFAPCLDVNEQFLHQQSDTGDRARHIKSLLNDHASVFSSRGGSLADSNDPAVGCCGRAVVQHGRGVAGDLITRVRAGRLRSSELTDATITVTNLGDMGVETVYGVIYPPQVALVGFGKIAEQPWAENGMLGIRPVLTATLAGDHRATDGRRGAQFLDALNRYPQEADKL